jgi:mannosyl-oligosaccharide alpha-1,2-mannosidase
VAWGSYLGGLLSAYELTRDNIYLTKAGELGDRLASSFDSTKTGLPQSIINLHTRKAHNHNWNGGASILAEVGSVQLEFAYLAHHLNQSHYNEKARKVFTILDQATKPYTGLYPVYIDAGRYHPLLMFRHITRSLGA